MTLGEKICTLRTGKGLSQEDLAAKLEVSRQSVSKWETGQSVPDLEKIIKLADLFGVSVDELVREGERPQPPQPEAKVVYVKEKREWTAAQKLGICLLAAGGALTLLGLAYGGVLSLVGVDMCCVEPVGTQPPYLRHPLGTDRRSADVPCLLPGTLVLCHPAGCIHLGGPGSADPGADGLYLAGLEKEKTRKRAALSGSFSLSPIFLPPSTRFCPARRFTSLYPCDRMISIFERGRDCGLPLFSHDRPYAVH